MKYLLIATTLLAFSFAIACPNASKNTNHPTDSKDRKTASDSKTEKKKKK